LPAFFSFGFFVLAILLPCNIPEKTINGVNNKTIKVNFQPAIKAIINAHVIAPTALRIIPIRRPDKPFKKKIFAFS
jgi:hypothetical protein